MKYYTLLYQLNGELRYLIWISGKKDTLEVDARRLIPSFSDAKSLRRYAKIKGYSIEREKPILHDLDLIVSWLKKPSAPIDCVAVLAAWNLFSDIAVTFPRRNSAFQRSDKKFPKIYDKVFWGNNLPAVTPKGKRYEPIWSAYERKTIARLMGDGLDLFTKSTREWPISKSKK